MATTVDEMNDVVWRHEGLGSQIEFLVKSLDSLAALSSQGTAPATLWERIRLNLWLLCDFREAVRRQVELDESAFKTLHIGALMAETAMERVEINNRLNRVIQLAENAVYTQLSQQDLGKCTLDICREINGICKLIRAHLAKEDREMEAHLAEEGKEQEAAAALKDCEQYLQNPAAWFVEKEHPSLDGG